MESLLNSYMEFIARSSPMDNTLENDLNSKKVFTSKEILENQELLQKENNSSEIHDEL